MSVTTSGNSLFTQREEQAVFTNDVGDVISKVQRQVKDPLEIMNQVRPSEPTKTKIDEVEKTLVKIKQVIDETPEETADTSLKL